MTENLCSQWLCLCAYYILDVRFSVRIQRSHLHLLLFKRLVLLLWHFSAVSLMYMLLLMLVAVVSIWNGVIFMCVCHCPRFLFDRLFLFRTERFPKPKVPHFNTVTQEKKNSNKKKTTKLNICFAVRKPLHWAVVENEEKKIVKNQRHK